MTRKTRIKRRKPITGPRPPKRLSMKAFRLHDAEHAALQAYCAQTGKTGSEVVREGLRAVIGDPGIQLINVENKEPT